MAVLLHEQYLCGAFPAQWPNLCAIEIHKVPRELQSRKSSITQPLENKVHSGPIDFLAPALFLYRHPGMLSTQFWGVSGVTGPGVFELGPDSHEENKTRKWEGLTGAPCDLAGSLRPDPTFSVSWSKMVPSTLMPTEWTLFPFVLMPVPCSYLSQCPI